MSLDSETLEIAAQRLEQRSGNEVYRKAWRIAAKILRTMKPEKVNQQPPEVN